MTLGYALRRKRRMFRALPLILLAPALPPRPLPERPIFIVGCPRSGNSVLVEVLRLIPGIATIGHEGHVFWDTFHPPSAVAWESNALGPSDIRRFERRYLAWVIPALTGSGRFMDKTPRNAIRLPYIDALFPDAHYIFIRRDPRGSISSLITGWRSQNVRGWHLPEPFGVKGVPPRRWYYLLTPGWRKLDGASVEEACARQYLACEEAIQAFTSTLPAGRWTDVRYEDLVNDPVREVERVAQELGMPFDPASEDRIRGIVRTDSKEKWRSRTPDEIERIMPLIEPTLERLGYGA
jgi:LPS sulfotransferase NodH